MAIDVNVLNLNNDQLIESPMKERIADDIVDFERVPFS